MKYFPRSSPSDLARVAVRESADQRPATLARYCQYLKERFPLRQFLPLSAVISLSAALGTQAYLYGRPHSVLAVALTFTAILLLLLRLRLVDELKDLQHDRQFYPERPVARGLVLPGDAARAAALVFLLETGVAAAGGVHSLGLFAVVALYSFLTMKEFFCRKWLRRHFTVYVTSHEVLVVPVCFYLYSLSGLALAEVRQPYFWWLTAFIGCLLFLLEVVRKLRPKEAETAAQDTYTARYGIRNSCVIAGALASAAVVGGILTSATIRSDIAGMSYIGLAFLAPVLLSLRTFAVRPTRVAARAVLTWCGVLAVATSVIFSLTAWVTA